MEDNKIIDLYFARDENAIAETALKYGRLLRAVSYNILKNQSDSEECENDTYHAAWNKIPPIVPRSLTAFLCRIARNLALDRYDYYSADKRNRELEAVLEELSELRTDKGNPEEYLAARETADSISAFLKSKGYTKRTLFVRRYWYGDPIGKIAADYSFSKSKIESMLMRMRKELKIYLERRGILL